MESFKQIKINIVAFIIVAIIVLGAAGYSFSKIESQAGKQETQISVVCQEHKLLAEIARETLSSQIQSSKMILPKIRFPGLSHEQLITITHEKEIREAKNLGKLEAIARETC